MRKAFSRFGFLAIPLVLASLLFAATRIRIDDIRGGGPGLVAINPSNRAYVASVGSGLTLDSTTGTLSANSTTMTASPPQIAVYRATSGQTVYNVPSAPAGSSSTTVKVVVVYSNGLLQSITEDYTLGTDARSVAMIHPADLTGGPEMVQVWAWY